VAEQLSKEEKAFIASMKAKGAELASVAGQAQGGGFMDDEQIVEALGLSHADDGHKPVFKCQLTTVGFGKNKSGDNYFRFAWKIADGEHAGITFSKYIGLTGKNKTDRERNFKQLFGTLQRLGVDTTSWGKDEVMLNAVKSAKKLTSEKPGCLIGLCYWCKKIGDEEDPESSPRLNIDINGLFDASNLKKGFSPSESSEGSSDDGSNESFASIGAGVDEAGEESCPILENAAKANGFNPDDYETWEALGEELDAIPFDDETDAEGEEGFDPSQYLNDNENWPEDSADWIGAEFNTGDGVITVYPIDFDAETELFTLVDDDDNEYSAEFEALTFSE
jgi:hypothetical protein